MTTPYTTEKKSQTKSVTKGGVHRVRAKVTESHTDQTHVCLPVSRAGLKPRLTAQGL